MVRSGVGQMGPSSKCNEDCYIDIIETDIESKYPGLLRTLLRDRTTGRNIIWACDEYRKHGEQYTADHEITIKQITGKNTKLIRPRIAKSRAECRTRTRKSAEVFTPSWICAEMNNYCDEQWFGVSDIFNTLKDKDWITNPNKIPFEKPSDWQRYVDSRRLEITCGEGPYLTSRYDTTTGDYIPVERRIGILDRKLRVIDENTTDESEWLKWVIRAYCATYGYEYQGDNLLLARENLVWTFIDNYKCRFNKDPDPDTLKTIARIISWNIWQMDGLTTCVPCFGDERCRIQLSLFGGLIPDEGQPQLCQIKNWRSKTIHNFQDLKGAKSMKFDVVIGNPPYQEMNSNNKMSRSIYPDFVKSAKTFGNIISLVIPARWMSGESGPYRETQGFIDSMLEGDHIKSFDLYPNSSDLFNNVDIKGGVCFFIWDKDYSKDSVHYTLCENSTKKTINTSFKIADNIIIRFPELVSILQKSFSRSPTSGSMKTQVSSCNPFGFVSDLFTKNNEGVSRISEDKQSDDDYLIHGLLGGKRVIRYIPNSALQKNIEGAKAYKTFLPRANGSGTFGEVFSTPMIGTPMTICTDTFLQVGQFDNKTEAENLLKYIKTKYFRAMVGIKKTAVFNYKDCFTFVPIQDFTNKSDIDWSKSIHDIDNQLYTKYGLNDDEINFIETHVKEMN